MTNKIPHLPVLVANIRIMNKIILALFAFFASFTAAVAQNDNAAVIEISEPVVFTELLLPGTSTQLLVPYSAYAAEKRVLFSFRNVDAGLMKKGYYQIVCDKGMITSVRFRVSDAASCRELEKFVKTRFGKPEEEISRKSADEQVMRRYRYKVKDRVATLDINNDKEAVMAMN